MSQSRLLTGSVGGAFDPRLAIPWNNAVWANDPAWTNPGDGVAVDSWRNVSGGGDPASTTTFRPVFRATTAAFNNRSTVQFDRSALQRLDFDITNIAQPYSFVVVGSDTGTGVFSERFFGIGAATANGFGKSSTTISHVLNTGGILSTSTPTPTSAPKFVVGFATGATSSRIDLNGTNIVTGTAGTQTMNRFTLGAGSDNTPAFANHLTGHIAFAGIIAGDFATQPNFEAFKQWVRDYYAMVIA